MRKLILLFGLILMSCSTDNLKECNELYDQYIEALGYAGSSQTAIDEIKRQYEERKREAGCN